MGNPVVHFEMGAVDDQRLARFYADLFGWSVQTVPNAVDDHMETGAFRDPAGSVFGVYHHGAH
jgi:predicted enzyme related to lactoylglutathione lyase